MVLNYECVSIENLKADNLVVFIHGLPLSSKMWLPQLEFCKEKAIPAVAIDLRGFGNSLKVDKQNYSNVEDIKNTLFDISKTYGVEINRINLVGLSMGGRISLRFAIENPKLISKFVLVSTAFDGMPLTESWKNILNDLIVLSKEGDVEKIKGYWLSQQIFENLLKQKNIYSKLFLEIVKEFDGCYWTEGNFDSNNEIDTLEHLHNFRIPTTIIYGEYEIEQFKKAAKLLYSKILDSKLIEISGVGHMMNLEDPDTFNSVLEKYILNV